MEEIPDIIRKRLELAKMFDPLDQTAKRRWARVFRSEWQVITAKFTDLAKEWNFLVRSVSGDTILWTDAETGNTECMFCFINDITKPEPVASVFEKIRSYQPVFTYAVIHQKKDGEGTYDIFRFSRFSYLEHCNRVRP